MRGLEGVAVVTGAGKGIGAAVAEMLAERGAVAAVVDIDAAAAEAVAGRIRAAGGVAAPFAADVADQARAGAAAAEIRAALGAPRFLVNNAGVVGRPGMPFTENTEEDWDRTFAINVKGAAFWAGALAEDLRAAEGRIVNIASIVGVIAAPFIPPYSVSKTALIGLTRVLARQFAKDRVTVNAVAPGYVWSPLWEDLGLDIAAATDSGESAREVFDSRVRDLIPMGREQTPEDIAEAVAFLCSEGARNITGQVLGVDGGVTI